MNLGQAVYVDDDGRLQYYQHPFSVLAMELGRVPVQAAQAFKINGHAHDRPGHRAAYGFRKNSLVSRVFRVMRAAPEREWDRTTMAGRLGVVDPGTIGVAFHDLIARKLVYATGQSPRRYALTETGKDIEEQVA